MGQLETSSVTMGYTEDRGQDDVSTEIMGQVETSTANMGCTEDTERFVTGPLAR